MSTNPFVASMASDPLRAKTRRRFEIGRIIDYGGGVALIDVGATLADGSPVHYELPVARGFVPTVGQSVAIVYANDDLNSGYVVAAGDSPTVDPQQANMTRLVVPFSLESIGQSQVAGTKQAATKNMTGYPLIVTGITVFCVSCAGNPQVDIYSASTSMLSAQVTLASAQTMYEATLLNQVIDAGSEISVRCITGVGASITKLSVQLWCKAALP